MGTWFLQQKLVQGKSLIMGTVEIPSSQNQHFSSTNLLLLAACLVNTSVVFNDLIFCKATKFLLLVFHPNLANVEALDIDVEKNHGSQIFGGELLGFCSFIS